MSDDGEFYHSLLLLYLMTLDVIYAAMNYNVIFWLPSRKYSYILGF